MSAVNQDEPAFPVGSGDMRDPTGMTLRQYAAIKLKVPDSGTDWLDEMIRESLRDEFAGKAMSIMWGAIDGGYCGDTDDNTNTVIAIGAYQIADAMLKARDGGAS